MAIGAVTTALELVSAISKISDSTSDNLTSVMAQINNTKSISERAKKALFIYPVLFSPGVTEIELATKISKFLELQYGIFTLMTVGLNPSVEDGNISSYLNSIAAESYDLSADIKCKLQSVNPDHVDIYYQDFQRENDGFFDPYITSTEAYRNPNQAKVNYNAHMQAKHDLDDAADDLLSSINSVDDIDLAKFKSDFDSYKAALDNVDSLNEHDMRYHQDIFNNAANIISGKLDDEARRAKNNKDKEAENKVKENDKWLKDTLKDIQQKLTKVPIVDDLDGVNALDVNSEGLYGRAEADHFKVIDKLTKANPTMINMKVKIKGYESDFNIPIGLKANPHFVNSEDLATLLDSAIEDKRTLTRLVRLSSGEISFFKDFLLGMDKIKRDQKLYARFGQHPWYQQFMQRKENNILKKAGAILSGIFPCIKKVTSATSNYLPTASLILTVDEIESGAKMKYGFLLKNEKIIWDILKHLGLLCIGIYNPELQTCSFYFNGFKKPMLVPVKQMSGDNTDPTAEIAKVMNTMLKRGIM